MPYYSYHWGSNSPKASYGAVNKLAIDYNVAPSQNESFANYIDGAIHYFHGVNPQGIVYLSNMYDFGAERSANEIYHLWFYDGTDYDNALNSPIGPAPGFMTGGSNATFTVSSLSPPFGQPDQKSFLDFNDDYPFNSYEITEPGIYYQASYIRLLASRVVADEVLSVDDIFTDSFSLDLFPNPATETVQITTQLPIQAISVYSNVGQLVQTLDVKTEGNYDISHLSQGLYFVKVSTTAGTATEKLVVQ